MLSLQAAVCRLQQAGPCSRVATVLGFWLAVMACSPALAADAAAPTLLHEVVVETTGELPAIGFGQGRVTLFLDEQARSKPNALVERKAATLQDGALVIELRGYPGGAERARPEHRASSFVIDFEAKAFDPIRGALPKKPEALRAYAARFIEKKNLSRGYDSASVVAERREGDCTEHAVFLAAILRAQKLPARVVHGLVLLRVGGETRAFGHAWVEVRGRKGWSPLDAALEVSPGDAVYLPLAVMENEGPAHSMEAMGKLSPAEVLRVRFDSAGR